MKLILGIKAGDKSTHSRYAIAALAKVLEMKGAEVVIAACTELPLLLRKSDLTVPLITTTELLARRTVVLARRALPFFATI